MTLNMLLEPSAVHTLGLHELIVMVWALQFLFSAVAISRLKVMPTYMCFIPILVNFKVAEAHSRLVNNNLSGWVKGMATFPTILYFAHLAADIRVSQGGNRTAAFLGFSFPLPFFFLAW